MNGGHNDLSWGALIFWATIAAAIGLAILGQRRTRNASEFYTAGGHVGGVTNGIAISAEFTSAASLLGVIALFHRFGVDALVYSLSTCIGFAFVFFFLAERFRELGSFSMADVLASRFHSVRLRRLCAISNLAIITFYLVSQFVGAAKLTGLVVGLDFAAALLLFGLLVIAFVALGGMAAATWVQVAKAVLFVVGLTLLSAAVLIPYNFDLTALVRAASAAHPMQTGFLSPGHMLPDAGAALSLALSLTFGIAGLPHIFMRLGTVATPRAARQSLRVATLIISFVIATYLILSLAAIVHVAPGSTFMNRAGIVLGGDNLVFLHLVTAIGGSTLLAIVGGALVATILAVVAGLVLAGVSALAHDLRGGTDTQARAPGLLAERLCTVAVVGFAALVAWAFREQQIGFTVSLAFAIAACANFPLLFLSLRWPGLTEAGAFWGGAAGLSAAVILILLGPSVWTDVLGLGDAPFALREPALIAMPLAFVTAFLMSRRR